MEAAETKTEAARLIGGDFLKRQACLVRDQRRHLVELLCRNDALVEERANPEGKIARVRDDGARLRGPGAVLHPHVLADEWRERRYLARLRLVTEAVLQQVERARHARHDGTGRSGSRMRSVGVEGVVQSERLEDHRRQRLLVVHARSRLDDEAGKNVIGVGIEPSRGRRKMVPLAGSTKPIRSLAPN